ncbi:hypothetical protein [Halalkalicoccus tibetensis]|uniref:Uncharacterized protein n=1 Tax=Halalkalicoccus tibetensis TaxID=175632 RepID=A0ABD5V2Z4_9EURY
MNGSIGDFDPKHGWAPDTSSDIEPENQAKLVLSRWFGKYDSHIYWEKEPSYGYDRFVSTDAADKPDLLIESPDSKWPTTALEVKIGNDGSAIYDAAVQLPRYWKRHELGQDEYRIDGELIEPEVFAVATGNAPLGRLYNDATTKDRLKTAADYSEGKRRAVGLGEVPDNENASSETTTRIMWRIAREAGLANPSAGIGSLYSSALVDYQYGPDDADPALCYRTESGPRWRILGE